MYWADFEGHAIVTAPVPDGGATPSPVTLASGQGAAYRIAVNSLNVYWAIQVGGAVVTIPKAGGSPTTLWSGSGGAWGVAADANYVYWTTYGSGTAAVLRAASYGDAGEAVVTMWSGSGSGVCPGSVAVDATYAYWTDGCLQAVLRTPISGGAVVTLSNAGYPWDIAVDAKYLYWTNETGGTVLATALPVGSSNAISTLASGQGSPHGMAIDTNNVYWVNNYDTGTPDPAVDSGTVIWTAKPSK